MGYDEIVNAIYDHLIDKPGFDMCGPESAEALQQLESIEQQAGLENESCIDIEASVTAGFEENARNGFMHGFQSALALVMGKGGSSLITP